MGKYMGSSRELGVRGHNKEEAHLQKKLRSDKMAMSSDAAVVGPGPETAMQKEEEQL